MNIIVGTDFGKEDPKLSPPIIDSTSISDAGPAWNDAILLCPMLYTGDIILRSILESNSVLTEQKCEFKYSATSTGSLISLISFFFFVLVL